MEQKLINNSQLMKEWHEKNTEDPFLLKQKSHKKVWWKCSKNHEWQAIVANRTSLKGSNCPYCANKKVLGGYNDLLSQRPDLAQEFDKEKNLQQAQEIYYRSNKKYWWICEQKHSYESNLSYRIDKKASCPYCSGRFAIVGKNDLSTTHPELISQWHEKNNILPNTVKAGSNSKIWWKCELEHEWKTAVYNRTIGKGCPYCSNNKVLTGYNDIVTTNPHIIQCWDYVKNKEQPSQYTSGSNKMVWWNCKNKHSYRSPIKEQVRTKNSCPNCSKSSPTSNKEKELLKYIQSIYSGKIIQNSQKIINRYELDIYLPDIAVAFEFNGIYWHSHKVLKNENYHKIKYDKCEEKTIDLINIWEDEWDNDKEFIKNCISHLLNKTVPEYMKTVSKVMEADNGSFNHYFLKQLKYVRDGKIDVRCWMLRNKVKHKKLTMGDILLEHVKNEDKIFDAGGTIWKKF